jgi:hypothetical protein
MLRTVCETGVYRANSVVKRHEDSDPNPLARRLYEVQLESDVDNRLQLGDMALREVDAVEYGRGSTGGRLT